MPTKAELVSEIYLLLAAIHLHGFVMSPEMAQKIFDRWPVVIGERPESPEAVMDSFNAILQQRPARILAQDPAETFVQTETPKPLQNQKVTKDGSKMEDTLESSQKIKPVKNNNKMQNTPEPSRSHKTVKNKNNKNTPSPFSLASHSRKPISKPTPKVTSKIAPKPTPKPTPTPRAPKLEVPATIHKKEPTDEPSLAIKPIFAVKRDFINLADDISSDEEDDTLSKKLRMR